MAKIIRNGIDICLPPAPDPDVPDVNPPPSPDHPGPPDEPPVDPDVDPDVDPLPPHVDEPVIDKVCSGAKDGLIHCSTKLYIDNSRCIGYDLKSTFRSVEQSSLCPDTYLGMENCGCSQISTTVGGCCYSFLYGWVVVPACLNGDEIAEFNTGTISRSRNFIPVTNWAIIKKILENNSYINPDYPSKYSIQFGFEYLTSFIADDGECYITSHLVNYLYVNTEYRPNYTDNWVTPVTWLDDPAKFCNTYTFSPCAACPGPITNFNFYGDLSAYDGKVVTLGPINYCWTVTREYKPGFIYLDYETSGYTITNIYNTCTECCITLYKLTLCTVGTISYTDTDLSAYDGQTVRLDDDNCYEVESGSFPGESYSAVVVTDDYANCTNCLPSLTPCIDCLGIGQGSATITGTAGSGGLCEVNGDVDFSLFTPGVACLWEYQNPPAGLIIIYIGYDSNTGVWNAFIANSGITGYSSSNVSGISCVDGKLVGSFTLPGVNNPPAACLGANDATVTL